jgi:type I restriction enzyme S subunit
LGLVDQIDSTLLEKRFLYFLFNTRSVRGQISGSASGTKVRHTAPERIYRVCVRVPDVRTQGKIAEILFAYDDLIENNRRRMELLEDAARQLYWEWFVRLRCPGHEHTRIINGVPEGWERTAFENALVLQRGFDLPIQAREDGDVPVYGSTGINGFHNKAKVQGPGIVTGRSGTLGEVHYVARDFWPLNTALWVKEFKRVTRLFALFLLREMDLKQYNGGVSVPSLDRKAVHRVEILVPPKKLMAIFDEFASPLFVQIENLDIQNKKLRAARDLLLPRLMSGEIAV